MTEIHGFSEDQIAALIETWYLGTPINVIAFFDRADIADDAKKQVQEAGGSSQPETEPPDASTDRD